MREQAGAALHHEHEGVDAQDDPKHAPVAFAQSPDLAGFVLAATCHIVTRDRAAGQVASAVLQ